MHMYADVTDILGTLAKNYILFKVKKILCVYYMRILYVVLLDFSF